MTGTRYRGGGAVSLPGPDEMEWVLGVALGFVERDAGEARRIGSAVRRLLARCVRQPAEFARVFAWLVRFEAACR